MNRFYKKYRSVGNYINMALMLVVLIPMLVLSYYNHPSPADDYCYIDTVFKYGWFGAMKLYYTGWTGRYFGIFLNHSNPLLFHSITGFKILPVMLIGATILSFYSLFRHLTPTLSRTAHLGFAGVVFYLFVMKMASISEAFYWMAGFVTFTIPSVLTLFWITLVLRWYRQDTQSEKLLVGAPAAFLVFAVIGCSEPCLLTMVLLIGAWWAYRILYHRKVDGFMVTMLLTALFSVYLFFAAPGNDARIGTNPLGGNIPFSIMSSFKMLARLSYGWLFTTPLLFFSVAWLVVLSRVSEKARIYFSIPVWYAGLMFVGILAAQLFPNYYGVGIDPAPRVVNYVYFFFLIGWFYLIGVVFHYLKRRKIDYFHFAVARYGVLYAIMVVSIAVTLYRSVNVKMLYGDWLKGTAAAFDKEMYARYTMLENAKGDIVELPLIQTKPYSIFIDDDIKTDSNSWWNKCMAGYYGKKTITVKQVSGEQKQ